MRLRTTLAAFGGLLVLAGPAHAAAPAPDCNGLLIASIADDPIGGEPSNDQYLVTSANFVVRPSIALDIQRVFLTGTSGSEKLNLQVQSLPAASQLTEYSVQWDDPANFGYSYELTASFMTSAGTAGAGTYSLWRLDPSGSWISLVNASGRTFNEAPGVIQWDKPASVTWPATFTGIQARADQYETNLDTTLAIRTDTASALSSTQGC